jgi:hypothetical protein
MSKLKIGIYFFHKMLRETAKNVTDVFLIIKIILKQRQDYNNGGNAFVKYLLNQSIDNQY